MAVQLVLNTSPLLSDLHYEVESPVTNSQEKNPQFWVILNSKNPFQLLIWPLSRRPGASPPAKL